MEVMMWPNLIVGTSWSLHLWLRVLAVLLGCSLFFYGTYLVVLRVATLITDSIKQFRTTVERSESPDAVDDVVNAALPWKNGELTKVARDSSKWVVVILFMCIAYFVGHNSGYAKGANDEKQAIIAIVKDAQKRFTYVGVSIEAKYDSFSFLVHPDRMDEMKVDLCHTTPVDWHAGERLRDWTFEQWPSCKLVLNYHEELNKRKENLNARSTSR